MTLPGNFEVRNETAEAMLRDIGKMLRKAMPEGYEFALLIFECKQMATFYTSSAEREGVIAAMREFIARYELN